MENNKPKCYQFCNECLFYYTKRCVALTGDNYFIKINEEQANLIIKNKNRFEVSNSLLNELLYLFPNISN